MLNFSWEDTTIRTLPEGSESSYVQEFADEGDVIRRANRVVEALRYGMVACNTGVFSTRVAPFGGCKASGIGRGGGVEGMVEFYETKY